MDIGKIVGCLTPSLLVHIMARTIKSSAKRLGCLLSYSQAEPGRELTQPSPCLLAEPCSTEIIQYPLQCLLLVNPPPLCGRDVLFEWSQVTKDV